MTETDRDIHPALTPRQDATVCPPETPTGGDAGTSVPEGATDAHPGTERYAEAMARADGLDWDAMPVNVRHLVAESYRSHIDAAMNVADEDQRGLRASLFNRETGLVRAAEEILDLKDENVRLRADQAAPDPETAQAERWARRDELGVLLSRMERGMLGENERLLLRAAVERELRAAEETCAELAMTRQALDLARTERPGETRLRDERDRARREVDDLREQLAALPDLVESAYPDDHGAQVIAEHLRGEVAWPGETHRAKGDQCPRS